MNNLRADPINNIKAVKWSAPLLLFTICTPIYIYLKMFQNRLYVWKKVEFHLDGKSWAQIIKFTHFCVYTIIYVACVYT